MNELLTFALLLFSGIFSAGETSLFLVSSKKNYPSVKVERILKKPFLLLNTILLGNNLVNILFSNLIENKLDAFLSFIPYFQLKVFISILLTTFIVLIFGEILPKNLALNYSGPMASILVYPLMLFKKIFYPLSYLLSILAQFFINLWGKAQDSFLSKSEMKHIISISQKKGLLTKEETDLIQKIINFAHTDLKTIMIPRKELLAIANTDFIKKAWDLMKNSYSARLIVYQKNIDNIVGFVHLKDLLDCQENFDKPLKNQQGLIREVHFISETKNPVQILRFLRQKKASFVVVLDEYGGTAGIITLNGILQAILGGFIDDKNNHLKNFYLINSKEVILHGTDFRLFDVKEILKINSDWDNENDKVVSFMVQSLGKIPKTGQTLKALGLFWEILEVKNNAITSLRIKKEGEI